MPEIVVNARLESRDFVAGSRDMRNEIKSFKQSIADTGNNLKSIAGVYGSAMRATSKAMQEAGAEMRTLRGHAKELGAKLDDLGKKKFATQGLKDMNKEIQQAERALERLQGQKAKMNAVGASYSKPYAALLKDIEDTNEALKAQRELLEKNQKARNVVSSEIQSNIDSETGKHMPKEKRYAKIAYYDELNAKIRGNIEALRELSGKTKVLAEINDKMMNGDLASTKSHYTSQFVALREQIADVTRQLVEQRHALAENKRVRSEVSEEIKTGANMKTGEALTADEIDVRKAQYTELTQVITENITAINGLIVKQKELGEQNSEMLDSGNAFSKPFQSLVYDIDQATKKLDELKVKRDAMEQKEGEGFKYGKDTEEYEKLKAQYDERMRQLGQIETATRNAFKPPYLDQWEHMKTLSGMVGEGFGRMQNSVAGAFHAIAHPIQATDRALGSLVSGVGRLVSSFAQMAGGAALSFLRNVASSAKNAAIQLAKIAANAVVSFMNRLATGAKDAAIGLARIAGSTVVSFFGRLASGARTAAVQMARLAASAVPSSLKDIASGAANAAKGLLGISTQSRSANGGLKASLKTVLKYAFGVRSMFFLFRRLRRAISDSFGEMAKHDPRVKASIDSLKGALSGLKGSLATAFAPILTAVTPALITLINLLTRAVNAIGMFMAALTGQGYYQAAKGLGAVGSAAGSAGGAVEDLKRQLAGFDELEILGANSSGGGGGGGGGGAGEMAFDTVPIDSGIADFVQRMKDLFAAGEYDEIGEIIAGGINSAFAKARDLISWDSVEDRITEAVAAITGIFNSLVDHIDWDLIGRTFGTGINTIVNTINLLYTGVNWENLGKKLAEGLNGLVDEVDWANIGAMFGNQFRAVFDTLYGVVSDIKWGQIGYSFAEGLNGFFGAINWDYVRSGLTKAFTGVLEALDEAVSNIQWGQIGYALASRINSILDLNWDYVGSVLAKGLNGLFSLFGETIANINWAQLGYDLAAGINSLFLGMNWDYVGSSLSKALNGVIEVFGELIGGIQWAQIAADVAAGLNNVFININFSYVGKKLGEGLTGIVGAFEAAIDGIQWAQIAYNLAAGINDLFGGINWAYVGSVVGKGVNTAVDSLINFVGTIKWAQIGYDFAEALNNLFGKINWDSVGKLVAEGLNSLAGIIGGFVGQIQWGQVGYDLAASLNGLFQNINWSYIGGLVSDSIKGMFTFGKEFFDGLDAKQLATDIKEFLKGVDWAGIAQAIWDFLVSALKALGNLLWELFTDVPPELGAAIEQEYEEVVARIHPELVVTWGIDLNTPDGWDIYEALGQAYKDALAGKGFTVPAELEIPPESIAACYNEYVEEWNRLHPEAPIDPILPEDTDRLIQKQLDEVDAHVESDVDLNAGWDGKTVADWIREGHLGGVVQALIGLKQTPVFSAVKSVWGWINKYHLGSAIQALIGLKQTPVFAAVKTVWGWVTKYHLGGAIEKIVDLVRGGKFKDKSVLGTIFTYWWGGNIEKIVDLVRGGKFKDKSVLGTIFTYWWGGNVEKPVDLKQNGWQTVAGWANTLMGGILTVLAALAKKNRNEDSGSLFGTAFDTFASLSKAHGSPYSAGLFGDFINVLGSLSKAHGSPDSASLFGTKIKVTAELVKKPGNKISWTAASKDGNRVELAKSGGIITAGGRMLRFAAGGFIDGGLARYFSAVPHYAGGTTRAHGTVFVAGEAGPEVVGHVNGRTEILNKSQLAQAMYGAVVSGMSAAVNALGTYLAAHMTRCADAIVATIGANAGLSAMQGMDYYPPAMASGAVMPYEVSAQIAKSAEELQDTLDANNEDLIQTIISVVSAQTTAIVTALQSAQRNSSGVNGPSAAQIIDEINRRTQMFGASPLKGV